MEMESFMDDLLNFSIPEEEEEEESDEGGGDDVRPPRNITRRKTGLRQTDSFGLFNNDDHGVIEEEDLEWISNKNAFPVIETFVGGVLPSDNFSLPSPTESKRLSPATVLESNSSHSSSNSSGGGSNGTTTTTTTTTVMSCSVDFKFNNPVKARSKRRRTERRNFRGLWNGNDNGFKRKLTAVTVMGRKCQHCGAENTPQWRAGPLGPKTLCNACGVRYKSGRLVPEYRPANSPTFSAELHSNSHRKIVEMRKQFQSGDGDGDGDGDRNDCA